MKIVLVCLGFGLALVGGAMAAFLPVPWCVSGIPVFFAGMLCVDQAVFR